MHDEAEMRKLFQASLEGTELGEPAKSALVERLGQELVRERKGWFARAIDGIAEFWETTYDISLVPAVAAAGIVAVVFCGSLFLPLPRQGHDPGPARYMQRVTVGPEGEMQVAYIPLGEEAESHAENSRQR